MAADVGLRRELNLFDALLINVGTTLASAAFIVHANVLAGVGTPLLAGFVWILAGLFSWCGAVTFAELAVLYPRAGGEYVYLEKAYHPFWGFLYGWTLFAVIQTGSMAAVSVALMTYVGYFVPLTPAMVKTGAIGLILGLSLLNCISLRTSANTQNATTILKLLMVGGIIVLCFLYGGEGVAAFKQFLPERDVPVGAIAGFGAAMIAALWAYDGWISITFVGGEVKEPGRFLPRAMSYSVIVLVAIYVTLQFAYSYALPQEEMMVSTRVAADAAENAIGRIGGSIVSLAVIISCFAAVNGFVFTGARVYYAMAIDRAFFRSASKLTRKSIPANAIWFQAVWASGLTLSGSYDQLFTYVVFDSWLFYALGAVGVIVLRSKEPDRPRPYRVIGYPYIPILFATFASALLLETLISNPRDSLFGIGIMFIGVPAYFYWTRPSARSSRSSQPKEE